MAAVTSVFAKPSLFRTAMFVVVAIMSLFTVDTFLHRMEVAESRVESERFFAEGKQLLAKGQNDQAVDQFRAAYSLNRANQEYQLAFGQALLAAGRLTEAEVTLSNLLQRDATSGPANLAMAHLAVKQDQSIEAASYYHRAIYGQWKNDPRANRIQARIQLTDLLAQSDSREALLAELLPLLEEAPDDLAIRKRIGHLYIAAGSPGRATDLFRDLLNRDPQDADAYAGLGEAEFARGNYRTAQTNFAAALRLHPGDADIQRQIDLSRTVLDLDPTQRGLSLEEQYKRSLKLVELALAGLKQCRVEPQQPSTADPVRNLMEASDAILKQRMPRARLNAAVETNLDQANKLWQARKTECKQTPADSQQPVALVLAKVNQ